MRSDIEKVFRMDIIDAHAHCGVTDRSVPQTFEDYKQQVAGTNICGVALFSPVLEIYDRYDFDFTDTPAWQLRLFKTVDKRIYLA